MLNFIKFFQGYLLVTVTGYSPERFLNLCGKMNIVLWELKPIDGGYRFFISKKALDMTDGALEKTGTEIHVIRKYGIPFLIQKYRKHFCFLAGIGCALFLLIFMSQFIWKVEIDGNSYYSSQMLLKGLREEGIGYGSWKKSIDCKELQTLLRKKYEDITWVSAKIEGTRLYLEIQERIRGANSEEASDRSADQATNLIASHDGVVVSVTTRQGTPQVLAGDTVSKGDILVSGAVDIQNDSGEVESRNYVASDADVIISTTLPYTDSFSSVYEEKILTGKKKHDWILEFHTWFLDLMPRKNAENYLQVKTVVPVVIGSDFYLPFQIVKKEYLEYKQRTREYSEDEIQAVVEEHLDQYYKKLIENGISISENSVIIERSGDNVLVSGTLKAEVYQQEYQEISLEEMQEGMLLNGTDTTDDGDSR